MLNSEILKNFFVIIGGQRCGTTFLYKLLDEHPEIHMFKPVKPEPKIFLNDDVAYQEKKLKNSFNKNQSTAKIFGEKSTSYYEKPEVARIIKDFSSETKILMLLRNPIERALSNYFFSVNNGLENRSLEEVFLKNLPEPTLKISTSVSPFNYLGRGKYSQFIPAFKNVFNDQMKIIIFENLITEENTIQEIYKFLGVETQFVPSSYESKINQSGKTQEISKAVEDKLSRYYTKEIELLEMELNIDLSIWK